MSGRWATSGMGSHTECLTLSTSEWPKDAVVCSLSSVLEPVSSIPSRFFLSSRACAGILRRAEKRGKELPPLLDGRPVAADAIMPMLFANAEVTVPAGEAEVYTEGCLSFPGITGDVPRVERAVVRFRDVDGAPRTLECAGLLARCVQHEHDHCQGVLFIDRMTRAHQLLTATKVKKLQRETKAELKAARKKG